MISYIKKAINNKLQKPLDRILIEKTNLNYDNDNLSLDKIIKGETQNSGLVNNSNKYLLSLHTSSDFSNNNGSANSKISKMVTIEKTGIYNVFFRCNFSKNAGTISCEFYKFHKIQVQDKEAYSSKKVYTNKADSNGDYASMLFPIYIEAGDKIQFIINKPSGYGSFSNFYLYESEAVPIPCIFTVDKENMEENN